MATRKTKLSKPSGTNADGAISLSGGPGVLDLNELDDLFSEDDFKPAKGSPLTEFKSGLKNGFLGGLKTKDIVRNFLRSAAPDGYARLFGVYDDVMSSVTDVKETIERTNAADLDYLGRKAQDYLPQLKDKIPNALYKNMSDTLSTKLEQYQYEMDSQRDQIAIRKRAQQNQDENEIKAALDHSTLVSKENFQRSEMGAMGRAAQERAERGIRDKITAGRFDFMSKSMGMAVDSLTRIAGYNEQVNYGIQRKGLELQFRTYMGIRDLVKLQEANFELNNRAYQALVRNTGLPDYQKGNAKDLQNMGSGGRPQARGFLSSLVGSASQNLPGFLGNWGNNVQDRVSKSAGAKLSELVSAMRMTEGGPSFWDERYNIAGQFAGDAAGDFIRNTAVPMAGRKMRPMMERMSNRYGGGKHHQAGYMMDNIPAFMQEWVNNYQNSYGAKGVLRDFLMPFVPQFQLKDRIENGNYQTIDQGAAFNQLTQRSIVEVIPGLLSRAVQELRMIRTGRDDIEREVFDITTGKFTIQSKSDDNLQKKIVPAAAIRSTSGAINEALNQMDSEGTLSPSARKALAERMLRDASTNRRFDPEAYLRSGGYQDGLDPTVTDELQRFFRGKFSYDDKGKMSDSQENHKLRDEYSRAFLDIRSVSRDPVKEIHRLINAGQTEPLRMLGIIITEQGQDKINYERIWEIMRSGVTDHNPYGPNGGGDTDFSGDPNNPNFSGPHFPGVAKARTMNAMRQFRKKYAPQEEKASQELQRFGKLMGSYGPGIKGFGINAQAHMSDFTANIHGGNFKPYTDGVKGAFSGLGMYGQDIYSQARAKYGEHMDGFKQNPTDFDPTIKSKVMDLFTKFNPTEPIIKGVDFIQGNLVDVNTQKIITQVTDITGAVKNMAGLTVLTAAEAANGLFDDAGDKVTIGSLITDLNDRVRKALSGSNGSAPQEKFTDGTQKTKSDVEDDKTDWYLPGEEEPLITARGLKNDEYYNTDGKPVRSMADIKGDIVDKFGSIVATAKELAGGLWAKGSNRKWRLAKGGRFVAGAIGLGGKFMATNTTKLVGGALMFGAKTIVGMGAKLFNFLVETQNAYLPGEDTPVFTRRLCNEGKYFDEKGRVIDNFNDVYGIILDENGEPILELSQYKNLKNFDGSKHILAKNQKFFRRTAVRAFRAVAQKYGSFTARYMPWAAKKAAKFYGGAAKKVLGGFAKAGGGVLNRMFERVPYEKFETTDQMLLGNILEAVRSQQPEELREGSWQDKAKTAKENLLGKIGSKKGNEEDKGEKSQGWLAKKLSDSLKGLFGKLTGNEEEEGSGALDMLMGGGKKGGAGQLLKRALPYVAAGTAAVGLTGYDMYSNRKEGLTWKQTMISTASKFMPGGGLLQGFLNRGFKAGNIARATSKDFVKLRLLQYGITDGEQQMKVLELEKGLERYLEKSDNPELPVASLGGKAILEIMGINPDEQEKVLRMSRWMEQRFKPIFLGYARALFKLGKGDMLINEIDDKLPEELKGSLLGLVKHPTTGDTPYQYRMNPFDFDNDLEDTIPRIIEVTSELEAKYKVTKEKSQAKEAIATAKAVSDATSTEATTPGAKAIDRIKNAFTPVTSVFDKVKSYAKAAFTPGSAFSGAVFLATGLKTTKLTGLQSIRMRAYGLEILNFSDVQAVLTLESKFIEDLTLDGTNATYKGDVTTLMTDTASLFGVDISDITSRSNYYTWLEERFSPACRAYYASARAASEGATLANIESKIKPKDAVTVANAIIGAVSSEGNSIWSAMSIFDVKGGLDGLRKMAEADLEQLKKDADKDIMSTPTQSGGDQAAAKAAAEGGGSFAEKAMSTIKNAWNSTKETVGNAISRTGEFISDKANKTGQAVSDTYYQAKYDVGLGGEVSATGKTYGSLTKGNGGAWEQIPYPKANKSREAARPTFEAVAAMVGIPVELLFIFASLESNFDYTVKAATSSATGWFQFINGTWDGMLAQHGGKYGIPQDDKQRSLRLDPRINALMGACFLKDNYNYLLKKLGRDPTDVDLYIAHFMGPGGAVKFLTRSQDSIAASVFPQQASANRSIFYKKSGQPRTLGEIYALFEEKISKHRGTGGSSVNMQEAGKTMSSEEAAAEQAKATAKGLQSESWDTSKEEDNAGKDALAKEEAYSATGAIKAMPSIPGITPMTGSNTQPSGPSGSPSADSGSAITEASTDTAMRSAQQKDAARHNDVRRENAKAQRIDDIQSKQLENLIAMRDHMRRLVELQESAMDPEKQSTGGNPKPGNDIVSAAAMRNRPAQSRPSPLTL